jgi:hypothetical protein
VAAKATPGRKRTLPTPRTSPRRQRPAGALPPSLSIVTLEAFFEILDDYVEGTASVSKVALIALSTELPGPIVAVRFGSRSRQPVSIDPLYDLANS